MNLCQHRVSMDDSGDGRGDKYTDELIRQRRKPRKRRLVFSPDNSDEDERKECGGAPKAVKNVQNLEADDREDTNVCSTSDHKKESSNNVNAVLNESEKFKANDKDSLLFDDEDDSHNRDVIQPTDEANGDEVTVFCSFDFKFHKPSNL